MLKYWHFSFSSANNFDRDMSIPEGMGIRTAAVWLYDRTYAGTNEAFGIGWDNDEVTGVTAGFRIYQVINNETIRELGMTTDDFKMESVRPA